MQSIEMFFSSFSSFLWSYPMIILLMGTHVFFTIRLRFPQRKVFKAIAISFSRDKESRGDISQFGALMVALAATIGTGNLVGVGTAVGLGGPGAVLWCWLTGIFGMSTKYAESYVAVKYRQTDADGNMTGGPMYALEKGLGMKWLAVLFCIFTLIASFGIGNMVQSNTLAELAYAEFGISKYLMGIVLAIFVALVILFGIKGIARICTALVPFMAVMYILGCLAILFINRSFLPDTIALIFKEAFSLKAVLGGGIGGGMMLAARYGIARGLFSNESGMGSAPIAAAAAKTKNPARQALVSSTGTFWDTVVISAITGIVIVSSIIAYPDIAQENGALLTKMAFSKLSFIGVPLLIFGLATFVLSTLLGWSYYGEKAIEYLGGAKIVIYYRIVWVIAVFFGAVFNLSLVWNIADSMNALMAIPNIISILLLSKIIAKGTDYYVWNNNLNSEKEI